VDWVRILEQEYPERLILAEQHRNDIAKLDYEFWIAKFSTSS
jgi:hypothetical protein